MAQRTQLRLAQITGSFGIAASTTATTTGIINDQIAAAATGSVNASDLNVALSHIAGAIKRIHGDDSFSESAAGEFHQDLKLNTTNKLQFTDAGMFIHGSADGKLLLSSDGNLEDAILIEADGGTNETIRLHSDQGTGVNAKGGTTDASISLHSDVGGIGLYSGINADNAIALEANGGPNETIQIRSNQGTGVATANIANAVNASIALVSDVGGIALASGLNADGSVYIESDAGADETIVIHSHQGTGVATPDIANAKNASIALYSDAGGIAAVSGLNNEGAIFIGADAGADETVRIHSHQGTGVNAKGGSTDASINIVSDVGGIGLYTAINADNAITLEANGGVNETIQVRSNQGTGVATADIANAVNASIALVSDVGGIAAVSGLNSDGSIWIGADAGADETVIVHSHQGTGADSIKIYSDAGGVTIDGGNTTHGVKIGTLTSGEAVTIGHGTSEVTIGDNLTVTGDLTVSGDTTTVSTTNLSVLDSIIGVGFSGSNPSNLGDRAILFGRGVIGAKLPGLYFDGTDFKLASTATDISSGSIQGTPSAGDYSIFRAGRILSENTTEATSTTDGALQTDGGLSVALDAVIGNDLHLLSNAAVLNLGSGQKFTLTHANASNTATVSSNHRLAFGDAGDYIAGDGTDLSIVSSNNIALNADGGEVTFEDNTALIGKLANPGGGNGFVLSSSAGNQLTLDSNLGSIQLSQDVAGGGGNGVMLQLGNKSLQIEELSYDPADNATAFKFVHNDTFANQHLQVSGTIRFNEEGPNGSNYVALRSQASVGSNYTIQLPNAIGSANQVLTIGSIPSADQALLSFTDLSTLTAPSKAVRIVTGSKGFPAGTNVLFTNAANEINTDSDTITSFAQTRAQGKTLDVFVNGQLLLSGSSAERVEGSRDYEIQPSSAGLKFAFALEQDDVIQVIKR